MIELRDYQLAAVATVQRAFADGRARMTVELPTGTGKTRTAAELVRQELDAGGRVL